MRGVAAALVLGLGAGIAEAQTSLALPTDPWTGDFDGMLERRAVRVLVPYSRTLYFNDKGAQRGLTADALRDFEIYLNKRFKPKGRPITVVAYPVTRERLIAGVLEGRGDLAAGNLTVTKSRDRWVDFSLPIRENVTEIVVTGPASPKLASLDDLAGKEVHVRRSSSYYESLLELDRRFRSEGKPRMTLTAVPEALEDEDMMDMLAAGMLQLVVVDDWKAKLWAGVQRRLKPRPDLALSEPRDTSWAFRANSPKFAEVVNHFVRTHPGSRAQRAQSYPQYIRELRNVSADSDWKRFEQTIGLFRKYGKRYHFEPLMLASQGYQESRLDQNARSHPGAVGVMQLMPETGASMRVGDIHQLEPNIHAGVKYMRQLHDRYFPDPALNEQNRTLLAIAAYNAGPTRIAALREEARKSGLDANLWFDNIELVVARRIGQEPVLYVRNVFKYYVAYKLQLEMLEVRRAAANELAPPPPPKAKPKAKGRVKAKEKDA